MRKPVRQHIELSPDRSVRQVLLHRTHVAAVCDVDALAAAFLLDHARDTVWLAAALGLDTEVDEVPASVAAWMTELIAQGGEVLRVIFLEETEVLRPADVEHGVRVG